MQTISIFWDASPSDVRTILEQYHSVIRVPMSDHHNLNFDTYTFKGFLSKNRGGKGAKHYIPKSSLSIVAFTRSIYLAEHCGLHKTASIPDYVFSLWFTLEPQLDGSSLRAEWRLKRHVRHTLDKFDFSAWISSWYLNHQSEEIEAAYNLFRLQLLRLSKGSLKKFDENALSRARRESRTMKVHICPGVLTRISSRIIQSGYPALILMSWIE
ncbi:hypothetical protein AX16_004139 [Volvariella volvacea WC 439]|nr:hypothetical protein AX16_004139 [Volvariella volvacea WC 439]